MADEKTKKDKKYGTKFSSQPGRTAPLKKNEVWIKGKTIKPKPPEKSWKSKLKEKLDAIKKGETKFHRTGSLWKTVAGTTGVPTKKDLEREKIKKLNKRKKARLGVTAKDGGMIRKYAHGGEATVKGKTQTGGVKKIQLSGKHWNKDIG